MTHAQDAFKVDLVGSTIADRYSIEREISSSPLCAVFRAEDLKRSRPVALRVFAPIVSLDKAETQAWSEDVEQVGQWAHHHFLPVQDLGLIKGGEADGLLFSAEPFIKTGSLEERLKLGELPLDEALKYGLQLLNSLEALHDSGRYHLNLRPSNLYVSENDFGVHQLIVSGVGTHHFFNFKGATTGSTLASPFYLIPELIQGAKPSPQSDVYAFGVLLYELVTGRTPFPHKDAKRAARSHINDRPVKSRLANPRAKISKPIDDFISSCLEKDPTRRPQSVTEARLTLEELLGESSYSIKSNLAALFTPSPEDLIKSAQEDTSEESPEESPEEKPEEIPEEKPEEPRLRLEPKEASADEALLAPEPESPPEAPSAPAPMMNQTMVGYTTPKELRELLAREEQIQEQQERATIEREARSAAHVGSDAAQEALEEEPSSGASSAQATEATLFSADSVAAAEPQAAADSKKSAKPAAHKEAEKQALAKLEEEEERAAREIAAKKNFVDEKPKTQLHRADAPMDDQLGWFVDNPDELEFEEEHKPFNIFGKLLLITAVIISAATYHLTRPSEDTGIEGQTGAVSDSQTSTTNSSQASNVTEAQVKAQGKGEPLSDKPDPTKELTPVDKAQLKEVQEASEAEAKKKAEAEAEATKKAEAEAEAKKKAEAEAEAKKKAEAEAKKKAEAEAEAKKKAEAEAKKKAEAEAKKKAEAQKKRARKDKKKKSLDQYKRLIQSAKRAQSGRDWGTLEREAKAAIKEHPGGWEGHALLGEAYFKQSQFKSAANSFKRSTRYSRRASVYLDLGQAYFRLKNYREAQRAWEKAQSVGRGSDKSKAERYLKIVEKKLK